MKYIYLAITVLLFSISSFSQEISEKLKVQIKTQNISSKINDGEAFVEVIGGKAPYKYKWSKKSIGLDIQKSGGLTEGMEYSVTVTDAQNQTSVSQIEIEANSSSEKINSFFIPIVSALEYVIMTDVFAALHIYDPTIHDEQGNVMTHPNGEPRKTNFPLVVVWLIIGAAYFTTKMRFVNIWGFKHAIDLVRGKYNNPDAKGEASSFQALTTALSATVGLGNIAGVAVAISIGGPGATFWLITAGLLGMSSKFVECTLAVKYRKVNEQGEVSGGPMYYLPQAFKRKNTKWIGKMFAVLFAILVIGGSFGGGCMFQANQAFYQFAVIFPSIANFGVYFGIVMAILVGVVIIGGIKTIANVTDKLVPVMAIIYVSAALVIIFLNIDKTGEAFSLIINGAFAPSAIKGGIIGVLIVGFQRASFSNEAGVGSASIAHSIAKTNEPISEGVVSLLEPFIDTVIICTMTALVLIFTGFHVNPTGLEGTQLTSAAFGSVISWFPYILLLTIFLFAYSTMISWSYYGLKGFTFLFGRFTKNEKLLKTIYFGIYLLFVIVGSSSELGAVIDFSDMMVLAMAFPNIIGLVLLSPEVARDLKEYFRKVRSGEIKKLA